MTTFATVNRMHEMVGNKSGPKLPNRLTARSLSSDIGYENTIDVKKRNGHIRRRRTVHISAYHQPTAAAATSTTVERNYGSNEFLLLHVILGPISWYMDFGMIALLPHRHSKLFLSAKIAVVAQFVGSAWRENNKSTRRPARNRYDSNETSAP